MQLDFFILKKLQISPSLILNLQPTDAHCNAFYNQIRWLSLFKVSSLDAQILFHIKDKREWKNSIPTPYEMKSWF